MSIEKIWVLAELADGKPTTTTLELLAGAKSLGVQTIEAVAFGIGVEGSAAALGAAGASKVYSVGDLGSALPGAPVASAMAQEIAGGNAPDAILFGATYEGRDISARLSAKLGRGVITNCVGLDVEGDTVVASHALFGGTQVAKSKFTAAGPWLFVVRAKTFAAEEGASGPAAEVSALSVPDLGATGGAVVINRHVEERSGPKLDEAAVVVSGGRGLGQSDSYSMIEELAKL
ncbi:MAG TPA: electron transfer flavoprotein subunit alpha/FixB family protein, partial [Acidimicrobiales bacterium]|nr:electron transfer flavoprotein subunit alpha/FixB family protein [Acidimicrobiales bacterium]